MKIYSRIQGSFCGAILSPRRILWPSTSGGADNPRKVHGGGQWRSRRRQKQGLGSKRRPSVSKQRLTDNDFFTPWIPPPVLVKALPYTSRATDKKARLVASHTAKRWSHSSDEKEAKEEGVSGEKDNARATGVSQDKQELLALVDQVQEGKVDDYLHLQRDPYMRRYAPADGPELTVSNLVDDNDFPDFPQARGADARVQTTIRKLWKAINRRLVNPYKTDIEVVYGLYRRLPEPRITYLHARIRHSLMKVCGREEKNRRSMLRYFELVADIKEAGLRLTRPEWNSTMAFAARWVGHSLGKEAHEAMRIWKEMETDANIKSNSVAFNILFDVASKAGNFVLAEMLYHEMDKRGLPWNRYHHVSLIHYFGLKMDSDGIRAAYKEMVEAGELIDSVALNCVIAGFLRCGDEYAAGRVYERMKTAHERAPLMPYKNYMKDAVITKVLMMFAKVSKASAKKRGAKLEKNSKKKGADVKSGTDPRSEARNGSTPSSGGAFNSKASTSTTTGDAGSSDGVVDDRADADITADTEGEGEGDGGALRRHFQSHSPIVPDLQTYRIFLNHYAVRYPALDRIAQFLDDMEWFQVPLHGAIFLALFKGFALYGGPGQQWSRERLNTVYGAFQNALAKNVNGMYVDVWMARWVLRAFRKCDTEDRLWEVWEELKPRCETDFEPEDTVPFGQFMIKLMHPDKQHYTFSDTGMFGDIDPGNVRHEWRR